MYIYMYVYMCVCQGVKVCVLLFLPLMEGFFQKSIYRGADILTHGLRTPHRLGYMTNSGRGWEGRAQTPGMATRSSHAQANLPW